MSTPSSAGRFLSRDPIFDGRNWYSYGGGEANPLTGADPTGLIQIPSVSPTQPGIPMLSGMPTINSAQSSFRGDPSFTGGSGQGGTTAGGSGGPGLSPVSPIPKEPNYGETVIQLILEMLSGNPIPVDGVAAPARIPFNSIDRRRQQVEQLLKENVGDSNAANEPDKLTWDQDPEHWQTPYVPGWWR